MPVIRRLERDEGAAPADVQARVQQELPVGLTVQSPPAPGEPAGRSLFWTVQSAAWLMRTCTPMISGYPVECQFETALLIGCIAVALVVSAPAAMLPVRRAANLRIISALQYE